MIRVIFRREVDGYENGQAVDLPEEEANAYCERGDAIIVQRSRRRMVSTVRRKEDPDAGSRGS